MWQLQGFDSRIFVEEYWQKKPCLIRQAFADFETVISPEELAGLACEKDVHARLVEENVKANSHAKPWQLRYGPFDDNDFLSLPESHYSLLVSECEKWIPELETLLEQFRFIPAWRIDDLMISYASDQGSVGPHIDEYDVFLLQAQGEREWQYDLSRIPDPILIEDIDLAILDNFEPAKIELLHPGDMLYLPPGFAHHGIAKGPCMTYSIGFRAPDANTLLDSLALELDSSNAKTPRYSDPSLELDRKPFEITKNEMQRFKSLLQDWIDRPDNAWISAIGKTLSDCVADRISDNTAAVSTAEILQTDWVKHPDTRWLYFIDESEIQFYCNGEVYRLSNQARRLDLINEVCESSYIDTVFIGQIAGDAQLFSVIVDLIQRGALIETE